MIIENPGLLQDELPSLGWKDAERALVPLPTHFIVLSLPPEHSPHPTNTDIRKAILSLKLPAFFLEICTAKRSSMLLISEWV